MFVSSIQGNCSAPVEMVEEAQPSQPFVNLEPDLEWQKLIAEAYGCLLDKKFEQALEYANALASLNCDYSGDKWVYEPIVFIVRSQIYQELGRFNEASSDFLIATEILIAHEGVSPELDSAIPSFLFNRAIVMLYMGRTDDGMDALQKAADRGCNIAALLMKAKGVLVAPQLTIQIEPSDPFEKARLLFAQGFYREAIEKCNEVLADSTDDEVFTLRGDCYLLLGQTDLAIQDYKKGRQSNDLHLSLAIAYSISGDRQAMLDELAQVKETNFKLPIELLKQIL